LFIKQEGVFNEDEIRYAWYLSDRSCKMKTNQTSFKIGDYEVYATFSGRSDPLIIHKIQQILLSSFVSVVPCASDDKLDDTLEKQYNVGGGQHRAP